MAAYASALEAVVAASSAVNARSIREDREFIGAVLRRGADFHYSVAPGHAGVDRIQARLAIPAGFELVALWHTHGAAAPERVYFSRVDADLVTSTGKPLYLADPTGALRVLAPGAPRLTAMAARRLGLPHRPGFAAGEQVRRPDGDPVHIPTGTEPALAVAVSN
ncbi:MAG: DUF4329 domain-containing protein [Chromatiales bacterium]|nr:DUF4329 domain-containing protein [Chromatiales bacterium]